MIGAPKIHASDRATQGLRFGHRTGKAFPTRGKLLRLLFALVPAFGLFACGSGPFVSRYKLTLYVSTPTGMVVSSGVTDTSFTLNDGLTKGLGGWYFDQVMAEAQVIDLGPLCKLFLLPLVSDRTRRGSVMPRPYDRALASSTAPPSAIFAELHRDVLRPLDSAEGERPMSRLSCFPCWCASATLTVEPVDPDNLAKSFGPGIRMDRATINITTEPLTRGVIQSIMPPWFDDMVQKHASLDGDTLRDPDAPLSKRLDGRSFLVGYVR